MPGEFIGVIGPNGGGKTTFLKLLMGFLIPTQGKIEIFGKTPEAARLKIGYVPQSLRYDKQFPISVLEVVLMGRLSKLSWLGKYTKEDQEAAQEALQTVDMWEFRKQAFGTLSGGQAQRTLIARALISKPELLLLDEPTASVDTNAQQEIYELLKSLQGKITMLMVTHDLSVAVEHVEKVLCIQQTAMMLSLQQVCEHFALGLYHSPLQPNHLIKIKK